MDALRGRASLSLPRCQNVQNDCIILHSHQSFMSDPFFLLPATSPELDSAALFFYFSHSDRCVVISHCGFDFCIPYN